MQDEPVRERSRWLRLGMVSLPIIVILGVVLIVGPGDRPPDAETVMANAYQAAMEAKSYRFSGTVTDESGGVILERTFEGEYASPDRYQVMLTQNGLTSGFLMIGSEYYTGGEYPADYLGSLPLSLSNRALLANFNQENMFGYINELTNIQRRQDDQIDGVSYLHYAAERDAEKQIAEMRDLLAGTRDQADIEDLAEHLRLITISYEFWIERGSYLPARMAAEASFADTDGASLGTSKRTIDYYDFGKPNGVDAVEADGGVPKGWWLAGDNSNSAQPVFSSGYSVDIDRTDPENPQVVMNVELTNSWTETLTDVRVTVFTIDPTTFGRLVVQAEPAATAPIDLAPGEGESCAARRRIDPDAAASDPQLSTTLASTSVLATFVLPGGEERVEPVPPFDTYPPYSTFQR